MPSFLSSTSIARTLALSIAFISTGCVPDDTSTNTLPPNIPATAPIRIEQHPGNTEATPQDGVIPERQGFHSLGVKNANIAGVDFTYLTFDARRHTLEVVDQGQIGGTYQTASQVTAATSALATINGGFFTPEGKPLGLVYHEGNKVGSVNSSSLGSGVIYVDQKLPTPTIARRETFQTWLSDSSFSPKEVLQTGPFLVEDSLAVNGLTGTDARIRSLIIWDGKHHFALAQCANISLPNLAAALAEQPLPDFNIVVALNLDGGRSSDLNISSQVTGGPINLRKWWNKPVRNYLILKKQ